MPAIRKLGEVVWLRWDELRHVAAVIGTLLFFCAQPQYWVRKVRDVFAHQVMSSGVESVGFICFVAAIVGLSVVVQLAFWTGKTGQSQLLGPLLVTVVTRELGPLLTNLVVIMHCSNAIVVELAVLKINGAVRLLQAQGDDPLLSLVMPRVLGVAVSTFCLTAVFNAVALASGYLAGAWLGTGNRDAGFFTNSVLDALHPQDMLGILAKSILPALFTSATCCINGLGVGEEIEDIPRAAHRALSRSVIGLFVISALVSMLTYL